jgi:type IV secretory pathway TrbD component
VLTEAPVMCGLPRTFAVLFGALAYLLIVILKSWWSVPLLVILYAFARFWARKDPEFLIVFWRHMQLRDYYHGA